MTLRQLCEHCNGALTIPPYQRRYVWGQTGPGQNDAAAFLMQCLLDAYSKNKRYFLQGITLCKGEDGEIQLVDGQQRLTFLALLLSLVSAPTLMMRYACRKDADDYFTLGIGDPQKSQDIYFFEKTIATIKNHLADIDAESFANFILDNVYFAVIDINSPVEALAAFKMMNGAKSPMLAADLIKADIMRLASDPTQPVSHPWELEAMRAAYASEWEEWVRWWSNAEIQDYFETALKGIDANIAIHPLELLLRLALRTEHDDLTMPLSYQEFCDYINSQDIQAYHAAKHFFLKLRLIQKRVEEALSKAESYNRLMAATLLQPAGLKIKLLHAYFAQKAIDADMLEQCYKLAFLGMSYEDVISGAPAEEHFDEVLANLSMADVYHTDAKRDVFRLLLRLNIDEDIKLGRRFDFSVWNNRSLEHIYSKSKVWHRNDEGRICDGNDNPLRQALSQIKADRSFMERDIIVNHDGTPLSEHCIGNLVLLYGENNAAFGNADFEQKKMMFLAPGDLGAFQSRNLLHSVCVFAVNHWDHHSIIDNYNITLKNLKLYYGFK